ncbi:MAG: glycoside hydrolase family 3 C-terminal domain-containing protein [Propionibacteriaceae bacterium]|nr:glycoside hydrolase family 3 C-terminal domain-containing protein [Propionibacteriaceae bacterium]
MHGRRRALRSLTVGLLAGALIASGGLAGAGSAQAANPTDAQNDLEIANAKLSREAATQGMVLLDNAGKALPIAKGNVALFGVGAYATVKGGTGSGDVNNRYTINVRTGLENAGYTVTTSAAYWDAMKASADAGLTQASGGSFGFSAAADYSALEQALTATTVAPTAATDTAVYVISRNSGEGSDRSAGKGDYLLGDKELANIKLIAQTYKTVVVVLNVGGVVDTTFYKTVNATVKDPAGGTALDSLLLMSQAGQEAGNALADVVSGAVSPSGKLTDTWAADYAFYPASDTFASADGVSTQENYTEGIYVGYRYFDSFYQTIYPPAPESVVNYPFGYGLSYADFTVTPTSVTADKDTVTVTANVVNNSDTYSGADVVQVYFSAPTTGVDKPYQELAGYGKTSVLKAGEQQSVTIKFKTTEMSSYDPAAAAYKLEAGDYVIRVGDSSRSTHVGAVLNIASTVVTEQLHNEVTDQSPSSELKSDPANFYTYSGEAAEIAAAPKLSVSGFATVNNASSLEQTVAVPSTGASAPYTALDGALMSTITAYRPAGETDWEGTGAAYSPKIGETVSSVTTVPGATLYDVAKGTVTMEQFVAGLSLTQLANIVEGAGMSGTTTSTLSADGAAGYTTALYESLGIASMTLSDGPAGLRITQSGGGTPPTWYQYATAWPIGTMLAQTWDPALLNKVGTAIGAEMTEYGVTLWLAPGMNIHRDPLCGRNFEYYSEDPLIAGQTAGYMTLGVQSNSGVGVTLKHFAGNNQETDRSGGNDTIGERALREIYLKGFELAVKIAQPMAIMSSYNKINGSCVAGDYDILSDILRGEWGFKGTVMTDWGGCGDVVTNMYAGNDLIEPGGSAASVIAASTAQAPTIDAFGLPVMIHVPGSTSPFPSAEAYYWSFGNLTPSASGTQVITTTVDAAAIANTPYLSGEGSGGGWGGDPALTPGQELAQFASVDDAYDYVTDVLAYPEDYGMTEAQAAGISVTNLVGSYPGLTSFDVKVSGDYLLMRLGDLQRSAMRILKTVSQSAAFAQLASLQGVSGITVGSYSQTYSASLSTYVTATLGDVSVAPTTTPTPTPTPTPIVQGPFVTKVKLAQTSVTLKKGKTFTIPVGVYFKGSVAPTYRGGDVTWKSSNKKVATVSASGKIKALKTGTVTITATSKKKNTDGKKMTDTIKVTVVKSSKAKVTKVSASNLPKGKTMTLAQQVYIDGKYTSAKALGVKVKYSTKKAMIVSVDKAGLLKALTKGKDVLYIKAGGKTKKYTITVK